MFFLLPLVGAAVGAAAGAFTAHAANEKDRQAAKHHRKVANELSKKYSDLEKRYQQYSNLSKRQIKKLTRQHALDEAEKDLLRLALRLQQSLYSLIWDIDEKPTHESLIALEKAVLTTNTVLVELKEDLIKVPDRYFARHLERANEVRGELIEEIPKGKIYRIIKCQNCGQKNRIQPHDISLIPICGSCRSSLL